MYKQIPYKYKIIQKRLLKVYFSGDGKFTSHIDAGSAADNWVNVLFAMVILTWLTV